MKFFVAFVALVAVAVASPLKPVTSDLSELEAIVAAIQSPSTDPATAQLLEQMLADLIGAEPIAVGPAIVEHPISVGPAIIDFVHEEPVAPVVPSPVIIGDLPEGSPLPLVQIIVNVPGFAGVGPAPAILPEIIPTPVHVVDSGDIIIPAPVQVVEIEPTPIQVVDVAPVAPVQVVDITPVSPIQVVDGAPIAVEPVLVGVPVIPVPAVNLPEELL